MHIQFGMKKNIVLLDDDVMSLRSLENTLQEWGYHTVSFLEYSKDFSHFDFNDTCCFIVDYHLNCTDGISVLHVLKKLYPNLKSLLISGYIIDEDTLKQNRTYFSHFMTKPINIRQLNEFLLKIQKEEE